MRRLLHALCALVLVLLLVPTAFAQDSNWSELRTQRFAILYAGSNQATAQQYAGFVDGLYDEVTAVFNHQTSTPLTLRLFPTLESYYNVNPIARSMQGIVAHADYRRHEVVVILPQTRSQTPDGIQNNIRHELTHIIAAELSEDRLDVLFQEGTAQYVEHPSLELEAKVRLLQSALQSNALLNWNQLDDRDTFYQASQVSYPESLSVAAFLIGRYSFAKYRDMLTITAHSSGYRSALERTYGIAADKLEQDWHAWLPTYLSGSYRQNVLTTYDLSPIEALLNQGRYAEAQQELENAIKWLHTTDQADVLVAAQKLLNRSLAGQQAQGLANDARAAIEATDYAKAADLVAKAQQSFHDLGDTQQDAVLADYSARVERGLKADTMLQEAGTLAQQWRYPEARAAADQAAAEYIALGATDRATQARTFRDSMDQRQSLAGIILLVVGLLGSVVSLLRRFTVREAEAW